jgi:hypothetical protein
MTHLPSHQCQWIQEQPWTHPVTLLSSACASPDTYNNYHQEDTEFYVTHIGRCRHHYWNQLAEMPQPGHQLGQQLPCIFSLPKNLLTVIQTQSQSKPSPGKLHSNIQHAHPQNDNTLDYEPPFANIGAAIFPSTQTTIPLFPDEEICPIFLPAWQRTSRAKSTASTDIAARLSQARNHLKTSSPMNICSIEKYSTKSPPIASQNTNPGTTP